MYVGEKGSLEPQGLSEDSDGNIIVADASKKLILISFLLASATMILPSLSSDKIFSPDGKSIMKIAG